MSKGQHNIHFTAYLRLAEREVRLGWLSSSTSVQPSPSTQKVVCSWCNSLMREGGHPISHGLCPSCSITLNDDLDKMDAAQQIAVLMVERRIEEVARLRRRVG